VYLRFPQEWLDYDIVMCEIFEIYCVKFESDLTKDEMISLDLDILLFQHKIVIINIELEHEYNDLLDFYYEFIELLENVKIDD